MICFVSRRKSHKTCASSSNAIFPEHGNHNEGVLSLTNVKFWWGGYFNTQYFGNFATGEVAVLMKQTHGIRNDNSSSAFYEVLNR